ncbi:MAG: hypothetical protein U9R64_12270 [Pseudomonadota bacterium]|nr:hypothetical protein [Pseudomonadota bacterium]
MKIVALERTAMINGLPKGPNDGPQTVTNALAKHLVDNGDVLEQNVLDADIDNPTEEPADDEAISGKKFDRAVEKAVNAKLGHLRADHDKQLAAALDKQKAEGDAALEAELTRIREDGDRKLAEALEAQTAEQDAAFDQRVAEAVKAAAK